MGEKGIGSVHEHDTGDSQRVWDFACRFSEEAVNSAESTDPVPASGNLAENILPTLAPFHPARNASEATTNATTMLRGQEGRHSLSLTPLGPGKSFTTESELPRPSNSTLHSATRSMYFEWGFWHSSSPEPLKDDDSSNDEDADTSPLTIALTPASCVGGPGKNKK